MSRALAILHPNPLGGLPRSPVSRLARVVGAALVMAGAAVALDTPLVVPFPGSGSTRVVVISPTVGTATVYEVEDQRSTRRGSANFLADLEVNEKVYPAQPERAVPYHALRLGSLNTEPRSVAFTLLDALMPKQATEQERTAGADRMYTRAMAMEDAFWGKERAYDGVIRAAVSPGSHLMIVVPSKHVFMLYRAEGDDLKLVGWRNYGTEFFITRFYGIAQDPNALANAAIARASPEDKKATEEAVASAGANSVPLFPSSGPAPETPASEPWVAGLAPDNFVIVDSGLKRVMLYQHTGKYIRLAAVVNIDLLLTVQTLLRQSIQSDPKEEVLIEAFNRDPNRKRLIERDGLVVTRESVLALVAQTQKGEGVKEGALQACVQGNNLVLDFTDQRKLMTFSLLGGEQLYVSSIRDYTIELGLTLMDQSFKNKAMARELLTMAVKNASANAGAAFLNLKSALRFDPFLHADAEKESRLKELRKNPDWQTTIDEAIKAAEELKAKAEERRKMAEEERKKKPGAK